VGSAVFLAGLLTRWAGWLATGGCSMCVTCVVYCWLRLQETSLKWMVNNYRGEVRNGKWWPRNCILGDEVRRAQQHWLPT
jgi:hypothetical protein